MFSYNPDSNLLHFQDISTTVLSVKRNSDISIIILTSVNLVVMSGL